MVMKSNKVLVILFFVLVLILFGLGLIYVLLGDGGEVFQTNENGNVVGQITGEGEVADVDGNLYKTVKIGKQIWMAENLKTKHLVGKSWCYSDEEMHCEKYGRLYDWEAAMAGDLEAGSQGLCPDGWHLPTDEDWYLLESNFASGFCDAHRLSWGCNPVGKALKTSEWGGDGSSGFNVLPAGVIDREGRSGFLLSYAYFWTSSKLGDGVWRRAFLDSQDNILRNTENPNFGYSVRCVKD